MSHRLGLVLAILLVEFACAPREVAPACDAYIACQAAFDDAADLEPADVSAYAEDGPCWGDPRSSDRCAAECAANMDALRAAAGDAGLEVPACDVESDGLLTPEAT